MIGFQWKSVCTHASLFFHSHFFFFFYHQSNYRRFDLSFHLKFFYVGFNDMEMLTVYCLLMTNLLTFPFSGSNMAI